ncbi:hypothetical protein PVAND_004770 [Polypedilum vanderplanki]|uniref:Uncharacterized protein n=1 Tax=Polypedilum vanderplanki TaxID=319348 RepID=A0A9J6BY85_POLVA|nr:hypothetical protein PVAND_004770 [Polypedilum vanderplanki]
MKLLFCLVLFVAFYKNQALPVTETIDESSTIDNLIIADINENEIDGNLTKIEEESTTTSIEIETEQEITTIAATESLITENSTLTQRNETTAATISPQASDLIKMRIIQYYREKMRAHVFRTLYAVLYEMKQRQQQQQQQQHALESQIVETRATKPLSAGSSCKCNCRASDDSKVIVYDGNKRKYVRIDREDLLPKEVSSQSNIGNEKDFQEHEKMMKEWNSIRRAHDSVKPKQCSSCRIAGIEGMLYGY